MPVIKSKYQESEQAYLAHFLPADHNEQDILYIKKRYQWHQRKIPYNQVSESYQGTTFQKIGEDPGRLIEYLNQVLKNKL